MTYTFIITSHLELKVNKKIYTKQIDKIDDTDKTYGQTYGWTVGNRRDWISYTNPSN